MASFVVELDNAEAKQIAAQARARGYPSITAYLRALVAADALVEALRPDFTDAEQDADRLEAGLRDAWHDAMTGRVSRIDDLWDSLDDDE